MVAVGLESGSDGWIVLSPFLLSFLPLYIRLRYQGDGYAANLGDIESHLTDEQTLKDIERLRRRIRYGVRVSGSESGCVALALLDTIRSVPDGLCGKTLISSNRVAISPTKETSTQVHRRPPRIDLEKMDDQCNKKYIAAHRELKNWTSNVNLPNTTIGWYTYTIYIHRKKYMQPLSDIAVT